MANPDFLFSHPFPLGEDKREYELLTNQYVSSDSFRGLDMLVVEPEGLTLLAEKSLRNCSFMLRTDHLEQMGNILKDPDASVNDRFVALSLLKNAAIAAKGQLPFCQDTGTATIYAHKGNRIYTNGNDYEALAKGVYQVYTKENLRYSQLSPLSMYQEVNTQTNLPAQIDIYSKESDEYSFLFLAKGGGSANKTALYQESKALLTPERLKAFLLNELRSLGTAACPPYHLAFVIGGTSADECLRVAKLASARYLDSLPTKGGELGQAFRDIELEAEVLSMAQGLGIGAQFGGKYFALDVRIIRLPRHGASCPVGRAVSCAADRHILAKINREGIWIEKLEANPERFIPAELRDVQSDSGEKVDLNRPMNEILAQLSHYNIGARLSLTGTLIVARDAAHARLKEGLDRGEGLPEYLKDHPIYYAGPAKTPAGMPSGSFGPTTAGRMDSYIDLFQRYGASLITIAKGERGKEVTDSCKKHGGFYLGSLGGPAALIAQNHIRKVELLEYPDLGMEAIYRIEVVDFPVFILVDSKGNSIY